MEDFENDQVRLQDFSKGGNEHNFFSRKGNKKLREKRAKIAPALTNFAPPPPLVIFDPFFVVKFYLMYVFLPENCKSIGNIKKNTFNKNPLKHFLKPPPSQPPPELLVLLLLM